MREEELVSLIRKIQQRRSELQNVELKAAETDFPKKIYDTLSSFSNQDDGGVIIFGISQEDNYKIVGVYDLEKAQRKAMEACEQMEPAVRAVFTSAEIDGKCVLSAEIPSVEYWLRPVFYKGAGRLKGSYVRVGDADEPMTEYEVYSFESFRRRSRDELRTVQECRLDMLDSDRLGKYLFAVKREREKLAKLSDSEILELMGITSKGIPTLAGVLSFALYPQTWFSQLCITAVSIPGTEIGDSDQEGARFLDNKRITGAIPEMLDDTVEYVRKNMRTKTVIDPDGHRADRTEYPIVAVREAVLNALIHRDYSLLSENTPVSIEMYRDRMEISSKGGIYGGGPLSQLGKGRPETRNPALANILELLKITENRYSGIPTIFKAFREAGLPKPEFEIKHGLFKVIFRNGIEVTESEIDKSDISKAIVQFCMVPKSREELVAFTGKSRFFTMSSIMKPLIEQGLIQLTIPEKPKSPNQRFVSIGGKKSS
ncbi:MAG: putative DNA binding domain-containing protein [Clostridia bacterium]|nr:putative DNA binding domain-containing protein [Clostridia bacterium]